MPRKRSLFWRIYPSHLLLACLCLGASGWLALSSVKDFYLDQTFEELRGQGRLLQVQLQPLLHPLDAGAVDRLCKVAGERVRTRITVILPDGRVIGDSAADPSRMDNHRDRPEVMEAFRTGEGRALRTSRTVKKRMLYLGLRVGLPQGAPAILRLSVAMKNLESALASVQKRLFWGGLAIALVAALWSLLVARRLSRPLQELRRAADRLARGDFRIPHVRAHAAEVSALAQTMRRMARELQERMAELTRQRNEMERVLDAMVEGVLAVDTEERLIRINNAAGEMLQCHPERTVGKSIQEAVRNPGLQRFVKRALNAGDRSLEETVRVPSPAGSERFLHCHGVPLRRADGQVAGALVVLNDISNLRRLESIRRDFVANVSHEIKTPITAIKGFVETLQDAEAPSPEDARRFLQIVSRHVGRLEALVDDLLELSRIEGEEDRGQIHLLRTPLEPVLKNAVQVCEGIAASRGTPVEVLCPPDLEVRMNPALLEQAVVNLLDNAVKYADPGAPVRLRANLSHGEVHIVVQDQGPGIHPAHHDRLFERFYRVDKARSRQEGGTGLGLSIVKHIVQAHGGRVTVRSAPGKGSAFTLHLPA